MNIIVEKPMVYLAQIINPVGTLDTGKLATSFA